MKWFNTTLKEDAADVFIFGEFGVGQTAKEFIESVGGARTIAFRVDCPGGDSAVAVEIYRYLATRNAVVEIVGECGSASLIATLGARHIACAASSRLLVHAPATFAYGTEKDLLHHAEQLRRLTTQWEQILVQRTKQSAATVREWLSMDTWFSADEARRVGLVDEVLPPVTEAAKMKIAEIIEASDPAMDDTEAAFRKWLKVFPQIQTKDRAALLREINQFAATKIRCADHPASIVGYD
jgi:ATP-dependent protease ClpP protease subunit